MDTAGSAMAPGGAPRTTMLTMVALVTLRAALPLMVPLVATIRVDPGATPVAVARSGSPAAAGGTVAIIGFWLLQVTCP